MGKPNQIDEHGAIEGQDVPKIAKAKKPFSKVKAFFIVAGAVGAGFVGYKVYQKVKGGDDAEVAAE